MILAALVGAAVGAGLMLALFHARMLTERSGSAVLLASIAVFYPVFAATEGDMAGLILHLVIFAAFTWLALRGFRHGMHLIAGGLIAHGLFDLGVMVIDGPGPDWWPPFCAGVDIVAGAALIRLLQTGKVAQ